MKKVMMLLSCLALTACISKLGRIEPAFESGKYELFDMSGNRQLQQIQLSFDGNQWIANLSKNKGKSWSRFCGTADLCQLKESSQEEIKKMFSSTSLLSESAKINCIQNISAAFCRIHSNDGKTYRFVPLISDTFIMFQMRKQD